MMNIVSYGMFLVAGIAAIVYIGKGMYALFSGDGVMARIEKQMRELGSE